MSLMSTYLLKLYNNRKLITLTNRTLFLLICALPTIIILYLIFVQGVPRGHDYNAHMLRLVSLSNEVQHQQFPYVFDYWDQQGIGFSWQIFYPPLTNIYLFISVYFFPWISEIAQIKLTLLQITLINFGCAFYAAKRQYNSSQAAFLCTGILFSSYYYITLIFIRFALSELAAIGFLILFIRGLNSLISDQKDKYLIPITSALIILTSIPIAIATIFFSMVFAMCFYKKILNHYTIFFLLKSLIISALISSIYLIPLYYNSYGNYIYMSSNAIFSYNDFVGAHISNLIWGTGLYPISLGIIYNLETIRKTICHWQKNKYNFLLFIVLLLASSSFFPWWIIPDQLTSFNIMQFPWRIVSVIVCFVALWLANLAEEKKYAYCSILILLSLYINPLNSDNIIILTDKPTQKTLVYKDYLNNNALAHTKTPFYEPINYNPHNIQNNHYSIINKQFIKGYPQYTINVKQDTIVSLPLIYYRSVTAHNNGEKQKIQYMDDGSLGLSLKKGVHTIQIGYDITYNIYGIILSALGFILFILLIHIDRKRSAK